MGDYFQGGARSPSRMRILEQDGDYVFGVEEIMRAPTGENRSQCSIVVYEFENTLIKNVWYYPAYAC
jgi:hypothetical protein